MHGEQGRSKKVHRHRLLRPLCLPALTLTTRSGIVVPPPSERLPGVRNLLCP